MLIRPSAANSASS